MPESPTANMGLVLPSETGDTGVWGSLLNTALGQLVDQHNHTTGSGVKVPLGAGTTLTADVPWNQGGTFYAITGLKAADFEPRPLAEMSSYAGALFVNSANNELTWRTTGGTNVQLTAGTSINSGLIGGFGGDYGAVSALADYTDADDTYRFRQQVGASVRQFAHVAVGDLDLYEFKANPAAGAPTTRIRHKSPSALAGSFDITWLTALPGSTSALQISSAGQVTASNTFANAIAMSASLTVGTTLGVTGATTLTGVLNLNGGITGGTNQNINLNGTGSLSLPSAGDLRHAGAWTCVVHASDFIQASGTGSYGAVTSGAPSNIAYFGRQVTTGGAGTIHATVQGIRVGDAITTATIDVVSTAGTLPSYTCNLVRSRRGAGLSIIGTVAGGGISVPEESATIAITGSIYNVVAGDSFYVEVTVSSTTLWVVGARCGVTHP